MVVSNMWSFVVWTIIHLEIVSSKTQTDEEQSEYSSGKFSIAYHILLPVAGLTLLLIGKKHWFTKLMLQLDRNCVSVFCPSFSTRDKLLKWACNRLPSTWSSKANPTLSGGVADLWKDGSLLCTLLNTAIPGACPNPYRHWKQPPAHAQAIAYKYLGIIPIFTDEDLSGNLSPNLECSFIKYLNDIQQAMDKISEHSETDRPVTSQYVARGMGLFSGEQHKKAEFYIYSANEEKTNGSVMVQIKGPYGTYGHATITLHDKRLKAPEVNVISDSVRPKEFQKPEPKSDFKKKFSKYFKKYHQKHLGENIVIDVVPEDDRAKLTYVPKHYGMYEINIISNGELLKGCPFNVHIFSNDSGDETSASEDKSQKPRSYQKRKVISKTIDLIDEKIPLSELEEKYQTPEPVAETEQAPKKPKFNFIEVVEEITKNNEEFKDIFDVDQTGEVTETCLIEELDESSAYFAQTDDDSVISSEPIVQEADSTSSLEAEAPRQFEIEEVDENDGVINFNVEIQIPVIEDALQGSDKYNLCEENAVIHQQGILHIPDEENATRISENEETFNREQNSKNYHSSVQQSSDEGRQSSSGQASEIDQDPFSNIVDSADLTKGRESHSNLKETELLQSNLNSPLCKLDDANITRISENGLDVPDGQQLSDLSLSSIHEEDNFASVSDNENNVTDSEPHPEKHSSSRKYMVCNLNQNDISNKQRTIADDNSKVNNRADMRVFTNRSVVNAEEDCEKLHFQIGSKCMNNNINRIKIPEKFAENPKSIVKNNLEHRYFSQKISNSERSDTTVSTKIENYTNTEYRNEKIGDGDVFIGNMVGVANKVKLNASPSRFFKHQNPPKPLPPTDNENTSPICPGHIAPEVDFIHLSVMERRKIFAQNSKDSVNSSKNSSFSETENTDGSRTGSHYEIEGLSVLNVLDTLKQSKSSIDESFSLSSTKSLPDISWESDGAFSDSPVRERKNFWENVSRSSSSMSLVPTKKVPNKASERERCRLTWRKPIENTPKPAEATIQKTSDQYKSADDILSMTKSLAHQNSKNYKSMGDSLNESEMLTIDERKKMLLKQNYEAEKQERENLRSLKKKSVMLYDSRNINKISEAGKVDAKAETRFSVIGEKIRKYNSASNLPVKEENNNTISFSKPDAAKPNNLTTVDNNDLLVPPETPRKRVRSQFKRAIKYFQKLEEKSQGKTKSKNPKKAKKFALQIISKRDRSRRKGGSLNLPKISDRFSINNLYEDVVGNGRGSFKGTPNRTALVEALATFSRKENSMYDFSESEDDIKYEIFKNHIKRRKRRSIRSIFDVYY